MATLKEYKFIRQKYKDLINGYIRNIKKLSPFEENSYYHIPVSVNHLCAVYHQNRAAFNTKLCSKNLKFIDEETVENMAKTGGLCLFGEPITNAMCKIFRIEFTIMQKWTADCFCAYFGLACSSSPSVLMREVTKAEGWNYWGRSDIQGKNVRSYSIAVHNKLFDGGLSYYGSTECKQIAKQEGNMIFKVNDTVMFLHNFHESLCTAYYNNEKMYEIKITEMCILPTVSLHFPGEKIKVTKYEFE